MFFTSAEHRQRFVERMQQIGKIDDGHLDPEYAAAIYILTADREIWDKASGYVGREGIDMRALLKAGHFSHGYTILVKLAGNLFNGRQHLEPLDLFILDEANFAVALTALQVRRTRLSVGDVMAEGKASREEPGEEAHEQEEGES